MSEYQTVTTHIYLAVFLVSVSFIMPIAILLNRVGELTKAATSYFRKEASRFQLLDLMSRQVDKAQREIRELKEVVAVLAGCCVSSEEMGISEEQKAVKIRSVVEKHNLAEWLKEE